MTDSSGKWSLPAFAIRRPITVAMTTCTLVVLGALCWVRLPMEFIIQLWDPIIWVTIPYPGATPAQVEQEIVIPSEGAFKTIPGLRRIDATSRENSASFALRFRFNADMALASGEVRDRIERLKAQLPQEVRHISLGRFGPQDIPILNLALFRADNEDDLARYARRNLRNRLLRVQGVADVQVSGHTSQQIYVDFEQNALQSLGLTINQVVAGINSGHVNLGIGRLDDAGLRYFVRAQDEFTTVEELEEAIVHPSGVRLRDVAVVQEQPPRGAESFTVDGKRGVFLRVVRESSANTVATCRAVREEINRARSEPELADAEILVFEDQSEYITFALNSLMLAGQFGALLAFCVLWLFLRRAKATLFVALAIPTALVLAPVYIYFAGKSLNIITIAAMLISIGILVDNAIVVIENIHRRQQRYPKAKDNVQRGANEVALAITAATFTTLIVFVPVIFLEDGELSSIMKEFAGPIVSSLLASLVLALTVLPAAEYHLGQGKPLFPNFSAKWFNKRSTSPKPLKPGYIERLASGYQRLLRLVLTRKLAAVLFVLFVLGCTWWFPARGTGFRGFPEMDLRRVNIQFRVDPNYGENNVKEDLDRIVAMIENERENLQIRNLYVNSGGWGGSIDIYLKKPQDLGEEEDIAFSTDEARQYLHERLPERVPGGRINTGVPSTQPDSTRTVSVRITGDSIEMLELLAEDFRRRMALLPDLNNVVTSLEDAKEEILIKVDNERAAKEGLTAAAIARSISFALSGTDLPTLRHQGEERTVRGQFGWSDRGNINDLESMAMAGGNGSLIPLAQLTEMSRGETPRSLQRTDARSQIDVEGSTEESDLLAMRKALEGLAQDFELPRGYAMSVDENLREIDATLASFLSTLLLGVVLIYLLLAALFESWILPFSVLTTVPLAFTGVYWSLYLSNTPLDTLSLVGGIILCGVIVNNGIVIVDHINQLRASGMERLEAILEGGGNRLRPVLMTTLTTVLGVLPLAFGSSSDGGTGALDSLGRALVGGLTAGTFLTLFVTPLAYMLMDDLRLWWRRYFASLFHLAGA